MAAGYPACQVLGQRSPVKVLGDFLLASLLVVVALVVMKLLQDGVYLGAGARGGLKLSL